MRVLVVGANGLIGSAVTERLLAEGHDVSGVARGELRAAPKVRHIRLDMANALEPADWTPHLDGIDAVVNCAGLLQEGPGDSLQAVHVAGPRALFLACEQAKVRRVIQISALGVDRGTPTAFSRSKLDGDRALMARDLDWVIVRPSVVIGRAAYGGSALLRALASLPVIPRTVDAGEIQAVTMDDLTDGVAFFLKPDMPKCVALDLVGPRRYGFDELVALFRRALGWPAARRIKLPGFLFAALYRLGDLVSLLGWRSPVRSTAQREIARGATGDPGPWIRVTGLRPRDLETYLLGQPPSVQDRWFARLYLAKPFVLAALVVFWMATGLIALGPGWTFGLELLRLGGITGELAVLCTVIGAVVDFFIGACIAWQRSSVHALQAGIVVALAYAVAGTVLLPVLWADPMAPLLKILPIVALHVAALGVSDSR